LISSRLEILSVMAKTRLARKTFVNDVLALQSVYDVLALNAHPNACERYRDARLPLSPRRVMCYNSFK